MVCDSRDSEINLCSGIIGLVILELPRSGIFPLFENPREIGGREICPD
jgi:hypothetical protein